MPCLPVEADGETSALLALVENVQRKDLDVWEEAAALRQLMERGRLTQEETARRVGKSQSAVANKLRLLKLPEDVIDTLRAHHLAPRPGAAPPGKPGPPAAGGGVHPEAPAQRGENGGIY